MKCPLRKVYSSEYPKPDCMGDFIMAEPLGKKEEFLDCIGEACAWYNSKSNMCALAVIAEEMKARTHEI